MYGKVEDRQLGSLISGGHGLIEGAVLHVVCLLFVSVLVRRNPTCRVDVRSGYLLKSMRVIDVDAKLDVHERGRMLASVKRFR